MDDPCSVAPQYVNSDQDFEAAVARLLAQPDPVVALDTEFMREKTYYAKLCLLQIASAHELLLVDALRVTNFQPLAALLSDTRVMKVFHAGAQDIEILYQTCGVVALPYFDTQDAAELIGYSEQVGYGALVAGELKTTLPKADSFTDWARRPLTKDQLRYAADDVVYLLQLYPILHEKLLSRGRLSWLQETISHRTDLAVLDPDPYEAWRKVKRVGQLKGVHLAVAREVTAWRELQARKMDVPRRWVLSDESAIEIARRLPRTEEEMLQIRGIDLRSESRRRSLFHALEAGRACPQEKWPVLPASKRPNRDVSVAIDLMSALVRLRAREHQITSTLLATRSQLEALALHPDDQAPLLRGWRREVVGAELLRLLHGELVLSLQGDRLKVEQKKGE